MSESFSIPGLSLGAIAIVTIILLLIFKVITFGQIFSLWPYICGAACIVLMISLIVGFLWFLIQILR